MGAGRHAGVMRDADRVCDGCARRTWLLGRLAGHLDPVRARIGELLELGDEELIAAVAGGERGRIARALESLDPAAIDEQRVAAGIAAVCRCHDGYPDALLDLAAPPAVLHVGGGLERLDRLLSESPVAVVGARRSTAYGRDFARALAAGLAGAGLTVVSGMALGIDRAAHEGSLSAGAGTVAVLPGGVDRVYPPSHRALHARILERGSTVSELPLGLEPRRWTFIARNRIVAGLSRMTVVVQARERSGALVTAAWAGGLERSVGAVPGAADAPLSAGPHALLRGGATLVAGAQDVLDAVYGAGAVSVAERARTALPAPLEALLDALADGESGERAFARAGLDARQGLAALSSLELAGLVRRGPGGRISVRV